MSLRRQDGSVSVLSINANNFESLVIKVKFRDKKTGAVISTLSFVRCIYDCKKCPLDYKNNGESLPCMTYREKYPKKAAEVLGFDIIPEDGDETAGQNTKMKPRIHREDLYRRAIEIFGEREQINKLGEEMAELWVAICHYREGRGTVNNIAEELADVQIMTEQMCLIFGCEDAVLFYRDQKTERLAFKIEKAEKEGN